MKSILYLILLGLILGKGGCEDNSTAAKMEKEITKVLKIKENSGLACSPTVDGLIWTHNDSGNEPALYALNRDGEFHNPKLANGIVVDGAKNKDWEDLAFGTDGQLYIADIGDNKKSRKHIKVYRISEPDMTQSMYKDTLFTYKLDYPKGKMYDAESLFIKDSIGYIFTKERDAESHLFSFDLYPDDDEQKLELLGIYPFPTPITGADYKEDSGLLVLGHNQIFYTTSDFPLKYNDFKGLPIEMGQVEGIAWMNDTSFVVSNEVGKLQHYNISVFK